jgi:hypothetical protein
MSELNEVTVAQPLPVVSTTAIERANRLVALRSHPGFPDLIQIALEMASEAEEKLTSFNGWDPAAIAAIAVASQVSRRFQRELMRRIQERINEGILEARTLQNSENEKTVREVLDQSDFVRRKALEMFDDLDNRVAGSY